MRKLGILTASAALVAVMGFSGTAEADTAVACGATLASGVHTLTADLDCTGRGTTINVVDTAVLDLDGFTIFCGDGLCIVLRDGGEVHGGTLAGGGGETGVRVRDGMDNFVHDMHISHFSNGIEIHSDSSDNFIVDNVVTHSAGTGISTAGSSGNEFIGNTVNHSGGNGMSINSTGQLLSGNTANNNGSNGIRLAGAGDHTVEDNTTNNNGIHGIALRGGGGGHVDVVDNTANRNGVDGIIVLKSVEADLAGNRTFGNGDNGIENLGSGTCPTTGPDKNKARNNDGENFIGCS